MDTHRPGVYDDAFRHWKSARIALTHAISDYLTVSAALCSMLSTSSLRFSPDQALSGIDLKLSSLQSEEERLKHTRTTLANERNRSRVLSPVQKLPLEILATIFVIAASQYTRRDHTASHRKRSSPIVLSSVSSSWRHIVLGTPPLWSYINLTVGSPLRPIHSKQAKLWVEHSCSAVLYVAILVRHNYHFDQDTVPEYHISSILEFLAPLMHRVHALEIDAMRGLPDLLSSVLPFWARQPTTNIKKTLQIVDNGPGSGAVLGPLSDGSFSTDEFNSFFQSFDRLFVFNCRVSESVMFHEGLVELHLQAIGNPRSPDQEELVAMLATAPRLRTLVLADCWIEPLEEIPNPVTLNHLQFLSLESQSQSHGFVHVLPLLAIGSESLNMSLTLGGGCNFIDEARAFFDRTKVTRLYVWGIDGHMPLPMLLYSIPHLETLALDHVDIPSDYGHSVVQWPRLHTLYLKDPIIHVSCLQQLVDTQRSLKKLHIYRPVVDRSWTENSMTGEECAHQAESMHMVEDFKIEFDWGSRTIGTWDFVILDIW